jgi:hypothetical protein
MGRTSLSDKKPESSTTRVGRTLLSDAFDFGFASVGGTFLSDKKAVEQHRPCGSACPEQSRGDTLVPQKPVSSPDSGKDPSPSPGGAPDNSPGRQPWVPRTIPSDARPLGRAAGFHIVLVKVPARVGRTFLSDAFDFGFAYVGRQKSQSQHCPCGSACPEPSRRESLVRPKPVSSPDSGKDPCPSPGGAPDNSPGLQPWVSRTTRLNARPSGRAKGLTATALRRSTCSRNLVSLGCWFSATLP